MYDYVIKTLGNVRYVLDLERNLISLGALDLKGYKYTNEGGVLKVSRSALIETKGQKKTINLYVLLGFIVASEATVTTSFLLNCGVTGL